MIYAASSSQREERDGALTINCIIHIHTPLKDDVSTAQTSSTPAVDPIKACHRYPRYLCQVFAPFLRLDRFFSFYAPCMKKGEFWPGHPVAHPSGDGNG